MSSLQNPLQELEYPNPTKEAIVEGFWLASAELSPLSSNWGPYFVYYKKQCDHALHDQGTHILHRIHQDIIDTVQELKRCNYDRETTKSILRLRFKSSNPREEEILNNSVDLVARLLLMINVGDMKFGICGQSRLRWESGSLQRQICSYFNEPQVLNSSNVKLERGFTAVNINKISGVQFRWTNNLMDHLRLVDDDESIVAIFHQASVLRCQRNNPIFPTGFIDETIRTLALLFPQQDPATQKWLKLSPQCLDVDTNINRLGVLRVDDRQIEKFKFWHDRLIILKQTYDQSSPRTFPQWWNDRRNGVQWWTFWIACLVLMLTFVFGLIQSIEGGLQISRCSA